MTPWVKSFTKKTSKKSKERREEPLGTTSYQTSSKRSPPFWLLIGARKTHKKTLLNRNEEMNKSKERFGDLVVFFFLKED